MTTPLMQAYRIATQLQTLPSLLTVQQVADLLSLEVDRVQQLLHDHVPDALIRTKRKTYVVPWAVWEVLALIHEAGE